MLFKLDSEPGRLRVKLIACICLLGFLLYPGVPNNTVVSQDIDRNYGPFNTTFLIILNKIVQERMLKKKMVLNTWIFGLVVFGRVDLETGVLVRKNIFQ